MKLRLSSLFLTFLSYFSNPLTLIVHGSIRFRTDNTDSTSNKGRFTANSAETNEGQAGVRQTKRTPMVLGFCTCRQTNHGTVLNRLGYTSLRIHIRVPLSRLPRSKTYITDMFYLISISITQLLIFVKLFFKYFFDLFLHPNNVSV